MTILGLDAFNSLHRTLEGTCMLCGTFHAQFLERQIRERDAKILELEVKVGELEAQLIFPPAQPTHSDVQELHHLNLERIKELFDRVTTLEHDMKATQWKYCEQVGCMNTVSLKGDGKCLRCKGYHI